MIENYFEPELRKKVGDRFDEQIFMQDEASSHTAKKTMELLEKIFGEKIISIKSTDIWPPYSPDLNPCDYFLWGFLKDRVFSENIGNISLLKEKIKQVCAEITGEMCEKVLNNLRC
jgi:transposase